MKYVDHIDSVIIRPMKMVFGVLSHMAEEVPLKGSLKGETAIKLLKGHGDEAVREYGRTPENKLGPFSAQVI